jgi:hypothetical protein
LADVEVDILCATADLRCDFFSAIVLDISEDDARAFLGEKSSDDFTGSLGSTRNNRCFVGQSAHAFSLFGIFVRGWIDHDATD